MFYIQLNLLEFLSSRGDYLKKPTWKQTDIPDLSNANSINMSIIVVYTISEILKRRPTLAVDIGYSGIPFPVIPYDRP